MKQLLKQVLISWLLMTGLLFIPATHAAVIYCDLLHACSDTLISLPDTEDSDVLFLENQAGVVIDASAARLAGFQVSVTIANGVRVDDSSLNGLDVILESDSKARVNDFIGSSVTLNGPNISLIYADFSDATILGSYFDSADFTGALYNANTLFPTGFGDPAAYDMVLIATVPLSDSSWFFGSGLVSLLGVGKLRASTDNIGKKAKAT